jgi:YHS domain-containing protein
MKRQAIAAGVLEIAALSVLLGAQQPSVVEALDGVDPVLLVEGKEVSGKPDLKVVRGRFEYLFSSAATRAAFEIDPSKYEIQLNGACARMGGGVQGNPSDFAVVDKKIYIFGSDDCHKKFVATPAKFLPRAAPPMPARAADLERGRALVEQAVAAMGGAAALDAVTTYMESASQVQKRPDGDVPVTTRTTWQFPGRVRAERTMAVQGRTMTSGMLITPDGGWFLGQGRAFPQNAEGRKTSEQEYGRQLLPLLRTRHDAAFKAAAVGVAVVEGVDVDRVRVENGTVDVTLGLDRKSGRVRSLSFAGRNQAAEFGEYTLVFDDYRAVSGLMLPFDVRALFDGAPDGFRTIKLDAIAINTPVDPSLFEIPKADGK